MKVNVRLFARARDLVGTEVIAVEMPESANVADLRRQLVEQYSALRDLSTHLLVAVNNDYVTDDATLSDGADVAVFPPVSGG